METNCNVGRFYSMLQVRTSKDSIIICMQISTTLQSVHNAQIKEGGIGELLGLSYASRRTVPLDAVLFSERWGKAVDVMLEKITGVICTNKLRIKQLLVVDLNQVLQAAFASNISKLAQEKDRINSENQY
jgi:hypothetical protein